MILWSAIFVLAALVAATMLYAGRGKVSRPEQFGQASSEEQFRVQLAEIEADVKFSRLDPAEAEAAKAEIAHELMRQRATNTTNETGQLSPHENLVKFALPAASVIVFVLAIGIYMFLGSPDQPSVPYAAHVAAVEKNQANFKNAIAKVEQRLVSNPKDVRGWSVIGPAYMQARRYKDAANAFRKVLQLSTPTADKKTDLAEALMMLNKGQSTPEVAALLQSAADMDKTHIRSRFYLASEATRAGKWDKAIVRWNELIGLAKGGEPWLKVAKEGLAVATARGVPLPGQGPSNQNLASKSDAVQNEVIKGMVDKLSTRLLQKGGTLAEWTRLVRSQLVLGQKDKARFSYLQARKAYPDATQRSQLDNMAAQAGILDKNSPDVTLK